MNSKSAVPSVWLRQQGQRLERPERAARGYARGAKVSASSAGLWAAHCSPSRNPIERDHWVSLVAKGAAK